MHEFARATKIAWTIRDIQHRQMIRIHGILESFGLHAGQPRILHIVSMMNGATQREIAQRLQISPASLAVSVKRLQKAGFLQKVADERDLRITKIRLTEKGRRIDEESMGAIIACDESMLAGFTDEEVEKLKEYLDRIYQNLNSAGDVGNDT